MYNYRLANLCTIYDANINGRKQFGTPIADVCFGSSLNKCNRFANTAEYNIILITDNSYIANKYKNQCRMSLHQVKNYLRRISQIKPFKYNVYETKYGSNSCYRIDLKIQGTRKEITFVLQSIKRTYEWPYSFFLEQAFELQKRPQFKFDSIFNLYNVVFSSFYNDKNTGHSFSGRTMFEKYKTLKERLPKVTNTTDIYPDYCNKCVLVPGEIREVVETSDRIPCTPEQWTLDLFNFLLPTYIKNYNVLKR